MKNSLFGHLAFGFSSSPENLATEALCFILNRSEIANKAFVRFISQANAILPSNLKFETQIHISVNSSGVPEEESNIPGDFRPDFAGKDNSNKHVVIGEVKFWAGLTDNQPVTYLKRFPESSMLVFIAPSRRLSLLWRELIRRCKEAGLDSQNTTIVDNEFKIATFDKYPILVLTSWRKVVNSIQHAVEADGDADTLSDILQLQGLCNRMDETAFLPIQSEELTSNIGKRILQYSNLVDKVTEQLVESGVANLQGLRATPKRSGYGRYMRIYGHGCMFQVNFDLWSTDRETPLWFSILKETPGKWSFAKEAKEKLVKLEMEEPSCVIKVGEELYVPIFVPIGVEEDDVVRSLIRQTQEIIDILATIHE